MAVSKMHGKWGVVTQFRPECKGWKVVNWIRLRVRLGERLGKEARSPGIRYSARVWSQSSRVM